MNNIKGAIDITEKWTKVSKQGFVKEMKYYKHNGVKYPVDGHHVVLKPSVEEREVANVLASKYGKTVLLVPRVNVPEKMQTPDYLIDGEKYDLKTATGKSKNTLLNLVKKKKQQSANFIFDISSSELEKLEIEKQISRIYMNNLTQFVRKIAIYKNDKILKVYKKKRMTIRTHH